MTGTNIGSGNYVDPQILLNSGYRLVRLVSLPTANEYANNLRAVGIAVLAVVTAESHGYLCTADIYQIGNEPDVGFGQTPNAMTPMEYVSFWNQYRNEPSYSSLVMIGAGLASGQVSYWQQVQAAGGLRGAAGFAIHPYNKSPDSARTLLQTYIKLTPSMDCWVTEWNRPEKEIPRMQKVLRELCVHDLWFCSDCQVPGFNEAPLILHAN